MRDEVLRESDHQRDAAAVPGRLALDDGMVLKVAERTGIVGPVD